ncbi:hypothetical protein [Clostridium perfringens]|uniref:hypothetical protein n=1 Tax=Clostridium perfringens TaxID=1502 RepID=UPI0039E76EBE
MKNIERILEMLKLFDGRDFYGVNFYRGDYFKSSIGATKKLSKEEAKRIIEENIKCDVRQKECFFNEWSTNTLPAFKKSVDNINNKINVKKIELEALISEIAFLETELNDRVEKITKYEEEDVKTIICISEHKKVSNYGEYALYISLKNVTSKSNFDIEILEREKLSFNQRVTYRNQKILDWIKTNNVQEIHTNIDLSSFIIKNKLTNLKVYSDL